MCSPLVVSPATLTCASDRIVLSPVRPFQTRLPTRARLTHQPCPSAALFNGMDLSSKLKSANDRRVPSLTWGQSNHGEVSQRNSFWMVFGL
eukprot:jgi/Botrbrau1/19911/Bobra.0059s0028.1